MDFLGLGIFVHMLINQAKGIKEETASVYEYKQFVSLYDQTCENIKNSKKIGEDLKTYMLWELSDFKEVYDYCKNTIEIKED